MSEVFEQEDFHNAYPTGIERHFWNLARNELIFRWLRTELQEGDLVMDVGCGTGIAVQALHARGVNIRGVETGNAPVLHNTKELVTTGVDLFDLDQHTKEQIKAVLLLDVLEHMQDREAFLHRFSQELPNCQTFLITVPARKEIWSNYDVHYGHFLRYNRPTLQRELEAGGLEMLRISYFFNSLYLLSLLLKWAGIQKGTDFSPLPATGIKPLFHRLLGAIFQLESRLVPRWAAGSSIIAVARPRKRPL